MGGDVRAMDAAATRTSGLAIGRGRLLAVGSDDDVLALAGPRTVVEPLDGRVVLPGLVDPHNHLLATGALLGNVELYDCRSIRDVVERIAARVAHATPGEWVVGRGWDESLLDERRHPTRHDLDPVSPANPVVIHRVWNRLVANSAALAACGISAGTPEPPAGLYAGGFERDPGGEPTGLFRDTAKELVLRHVPALDEENRVTAVEHACRAYNAVGLTTVAEPGLYPYEMDAFGRAREQGRLTVRTDMLVAGWGWAAAAAWSTGPPLPEDGLEERIGGLEARNGSDDDLLRLGGVKLLPDGGIGDRTARLLEPYADSGARGEWVVEPERLREHVRFVHEAGWSLDVHTCGDEAQEVTVSGDGGGARGEPEAVASPPGSPRVPADGRRASSDGPPPDRRPRLESLPRSSRRELRRLARPGAGGDHDADAHVRRRRRAARGLVRLADHDVRSLAGRPSGGHAPHRRRSRARRRRTPDAGRGNPLVHGRRRSGARARPEARHPRARQARGLRRARPRPWSVDPEELTSVRALATMLGGQWVYDKR